MSTVVSDVIQEEHSKQSGKVTVRTRLIDVDRDKNAFVSDLHNLSAALEQKIKEQVFELGESESEDEVFVRAVVTLDLPSTAREFPVGIEAFKNLRMRCSMRTNRANVTAVLSRENYTREAEDEIKMKLTVSSVPFKDTKCVMEARVDDGAVVLEFRPIATLNSETFVSVKKDSHKDWSQIMVQLASTVTQQFQKHMQVYDMICVFRNIAFEATTDAMEG